ncbi:MAG: hypothetical protein H7210_08640 [Pyrinomonadaceae bacterium]|nr:hypothetical protein [Phycisphaerales bacterium]
MDIDSIERRFTEMGAEVRFRPLGRSSRRSPLAVDVVHQDRREIFDVAVHSEAEFRVVDLRRDERHLLIHATRPDEKRPFKFLCGHDERHWFVAGIPNDPGVSNVRTAMEALKPKDVLEIQSRVGLGWKDGLRRRNRVFLRQGEWFFIPDPNLVVDRRRVLRNEPMRRSFASKPHIAECAYRTGGETVMVSHRAPQGLTMSDHASLVARDEQARKLPWVTMRRNPLLYVHGRIRHPDHATIVLDQWHRVLMNEEARAPSSTGVVFLD